MLHSKVRFACILFVSSSDIFVVSDAVQSKSLCNLVMVSYTYISSIFLLRCKLNKAQAALHTLYTSQDKMKLLRTYSPMIFSM